MNFSLKVSFPDPGNEKLLEIVKSLMGDSFKFTRRKSFVAPDVIEIDFDILSERGVVAVKEHFRKQGLKGGSFISVEL